MGIPYVPYRIDDLTLLDVLTPRQRFIVERRIGKACGSFNRIFSFREIGYALQISAQYAQEIEFIALCKMRIPHVINKFGKRKVEAIANTKRRVNK